MALAALAVIVAAITWALVPFNDSQVRCATAATTALHGQPALLNAAGYPMLTGSEAKAAADGLYPTTSGSATSSRAAARLVLVSAWPVVPSCSRSSV